MTIRAVIFDIGGVLSQYSDMKTYIKWEKKLGLPQKGLFDILYESKVSKLATLGKATVDDVWEDLGQQCNVSPEELNIMREEIWAGYEWNTELLDYTRSLKPKYKTAIVSDAWSDARESMQGTINNDIFDVIVFSAEVGVQKPAPEIFERALSQLGIAPEEAIFVDDREKNIVGANQLGMHGVLFTDTQKAIEAIDKLLIK